MRSLHASHEPGAGVNTGISESEQSRRPAQQGVPVMLVAQPIEEDEINLLDLWRTLCEKKRLIAAVTIICTLIGLTYAMLATPVYHIEARIAPPSQADVAELALMTLNGNTKNEKQENLKDMAFAYVTKALSDVSVRKQFFNAHQKDLAPKAVSDSELRDAYEAFDAALKAGKDAKHEGLMALSWERDKPEQTAAWVNEFAALAISTAKKRALQEVDVKVSAQKKTLQQQINEKLHAARAQRQDRIRMLSDALRIAEQLGIKDYKTTTSNQVGEKPLYLMGSRALKAELESLKARKDDAPFIPGLRQLQVQLTELDSLRPDADKLHMAHIVEPAIVPQHRIKPKRKLITIGALLAGLVLGIIFALINRATSIKP